MAGDEESSSSRFDVEELYYPKVERNLRYLPHLLAGALRLVWSAARPQLVLNVVLQAVGSASLAAQVLVGKELLTKLLRRQQY